MGQGDWRVLNSVYEQLPAASCRNNPHRCGLCSRKKPGSCCGWFPAGPMATSCWRLGLWPLAELAVPTARAVPANGDRPQFSIDLQFVTNSPKNRVRARTSLIHREGMRQQSHAAAFIRRGNPSGAGWYFSPAPQNAYIPHSSTLILLKRLAGHIAISLETQPV